MKIVVVDDEPAILSSTAMLLEDFGHEVVALRDHRQTVETLETFDADVLLQDVRMPGLDIEHYLHVVRKSFPERPMRIILFSAGMDLAELARELPADAWLEKPFKPQELATTLASTHGFGAASSESRSSA